MTGDTKLSDRAGEAKGSPHALAPTSCRFTSSASLNPASGLPRWCSLLSRPRYAAPYTLAVALSSSGPLQIHPAGYGCLHLPIFAVHDKTNKC